MEDPNAYLTHFREVKQRLDYMGFLADDWLRANADVYQTPFLILKRRRQDYARFRDTDYGYVEDHNPLNLLREEIQARSSFLINLESGQKYLADVVYIFTKCDETQTLIDRCLEIVAAKKYGTEDIQFKRETASGEKQTQVVTADSVKWNVEGDVRAFTLFTERLNDVRAVLIDTPTVVHSEAYLNYSTPIPSTPGDRAKGKLAEVEKPELPNKLDYTANRQFIEDVLHVSLDNASDAAKYWKRDFLHEVHDEPDQAEEIFHIHRTHYLQELKKYQEHLWMYTDFFDLDNGFQEDMVSKLSQKLKMFSFNQQIDAVSVLKLVERIYAFKYIIAILNEWKKSTTPATSTPADGGKAGLVEDDEQATEQGEVIISQNSLGIVCYFLEEVNFIGFDTRIDFIRKKITSKYDIKAETISDRCNWYKREVAAGKLHMPTVRKAIRIMTEDNDLNYSAAIDRAKALIQPRERKQQQL
jgi:hypothetical protein